MSRDLRAYLLRVFFSVIFFFSFRPKSVINIVDGGEWGAMASVRSTPVSLPTGVLLPSARVVSHAAGIPFLQARSSTSEKRDEAKLHARFVPVFPFLSLSCPARSPQGTIVEAGYGEEPLAGEFFLFGFLSMLGSPGSC